jgi:pimeloyl-ACP methyl ester carboxylesterase
MGVYPFMFGSIKDFEPVVERLIKVISKCMQQRSATPDTPQQEGQKPPYNWDNYAQAFFPKAEELVAEAEKAEKEGNQEKASELYLYVTLIQLLSRISGLTITRRASSLYTISRFPAPRSEKQRHAWEEGKKASKKGMALRERPTQEVIIPHKHGLPTEGKNIPVYYHLPPGTTKDKPVPVVIIFTGLDGYRTELAVWIEGWSQKGVGVVILEIPGTGDSPAEPTDPTSPDREWSSLLDWVDEQQEIDHKRVAVWAFSTGGYYAIRLAHTHPKRVEGIVALGGGCHYMFDERWLSAVNALEYPFDLANTLAYKWGYGNDLEKFKKEASKFSLLNDGTLDKPECARLLLVNGVNDEIFPIDDYELCLRHGAPKEARFIEDRKHMGEPESFFVIIKWIYNLFGLEGHPGEQMKTIPSRPKY